MTQFYELDADLEPDTPAIQPAHSPTSAKENGQIPKKFERTGKDKGGTKFIIAIVILIALVALFGICLLVFKWKKNRVKVLWKWPWSRSNAEDQIRYKLISKV